MVLFSFLDSGKKSLVENLSLSSFSLAMATAPPADTVPLDGDVIDDLDGTGEGGERS